MKTFLRATVAAALFMIPGISAASNLDYEQSGSNYTVLFNPNGSGTSNLPKSYFYRSYDCKIGSKPVVVNNVKVIIPPPPSGNTTPPPPPSGNTTPPPGNDTPTITNNPTPPPGDSTPPIGGCDPGTMAAVPLPASSEMAGVGVVVIALASWQKARRHARA